MKDQKNPRARRLALAKTTIRTLVPNDLQIVAGGGSGPPYSAAVLAHCSGQVACDVE